MRNTMLALALAAGALGTPAFAGGTLTPKGTPEKAIWIQDHAVRVVLQNGFARTEVSQSFYNPNDHDLEALYAFPVPRSASLSEMTIFAGEEQLDGEVVARAEARRAYEKQRDEGEDAGLAEKSPFETFQFRIARVPGQAETRFRFVYYQKLELDSGVGRYLYPQEEGGTDELALGFWDTDHEVRRHFSFHLELHSAWPIADVRMPGFEAAATVQEIDEGRWTVDVDAPGGVALDRDLLVYYRLADDLPGRVELVPQRDDPDGPGTFMLVLTPGIDLAPLERGSDYVFVLDNSGSMEGKLHTLADGVVRALGHLDPQDRFRVVVFSNKARDLTGGMRTATEENVQDATQRIQGLHVDGGTNLYSGLKLALGETDHDRVTSLVLVTDAVANEGEVDPGRFHQLLKSRDVRVFGFLLGNNANWSLMRTICDASGGFYADISNADDVIGQIMLARSKVTHEALHEAKLEFDGARVHDVSTLRSKIYRGQQLVLFGRYAEAGPLAIRLEATITGQKHVYETHTVLPGVADENPEIERLWALDRIEEIQLRKDLGVLKESEARDAIADLGVAYQLVTDHTSMLVLDDHAFRELGIDRHNRARTAQERKAQAKRVGQAPRSHRIDKAGDPTFPDRAPRPKAGGGAIDPLTFALMLFGGAALLSGRKRERRPR